MANENIGEIVWRCHHGADKAFIRLDKREKLYIACPKCGIFGAKGESFQQFIRSEATMYASPKLDYAGGGESVKPSENPEAPERQEETKPERKAENFTPAPEAIPKGEPKKIGGLMGGLMNMLGSEE